MDEGLAMYLSTKAIIYHVPGSIPRTEKEKKKNGAINTFSL
jgi:hypothetical protein